MKKPLISVFVFIAAWSAAFGADYFFFRGKESDVPGELRFVRVINHRSQPAAGAKVIVSLAGKRTLEGYTDLSGTIRFPKLEVSRVESVRCEIEIAGKTAYVTSICADPSSIAWPVVFHLQPRRG